MSADSSPLETTTLTSAPDYRRSFSLSAWLFLRLMGLCYFFAFVSSFAQVNGLFGSDGILPAQLTLREFHDKGGIDAWLIHPTLLWLDSSDCMLNFLTASGALLSLFVLVGVCSGPALALLFIFYLSLVAVGRVFLHFQWDHLLLEAGFLAIFFAPWVVIDAPFGRKGQPYSKVILFFLYWLLFRLMFLSGLVKIGSHSITWKDMSAMSHYYETQLLPNPLAWLAHQAPAAMQNMSTAGTFVIELFVPFLIFAPRKLRLLGAFALITLQFFIYVTGNHGFFNILSAALCLLLLDDQLFKKVFPQVLAQRLLVEPEPELSENGDGKQFFAVRLWRRFSMLPFDGKMRRALQACLALFLFMLTSTRFYAKAFDTEQIAQPFKAIENALRFYYITSPYGLYANVLPSRTEIIIEGSNDLIEWKPYSFKYKIGDVNRAPPVVEPFQPRLDWRMRFAVLAPLSQSPWFSNFASKILAGSDHVLALLDKNPFPDDPPAFLRAGVYEYAFTSVDEKWQTGRWWRREYAKPFMMPTETGGRD